MEATKQLIRAVLILMGLACICFTGCGSKKEDPAVEWMTKVVTKQREHPIKNIELKADIGLLVSDDFTLRNLSDQNLNNVQLILSLKGKSGDSKELMFKWSQWNRGETKTISVKKLKVSAVFQWWKFWDSLMKEVCNVHGPSTETGGVDNHNNPGTFLGPAL